MHIPHWTWIITGPSQGDHTHNHEILQAITLHPQTQQRFSTGMHVEEENVHFCMDTDPLEKRPSQQKAGRQEKDDRILSNKFESKVHDIFLFEYVTISSIPKGKKNYTTPHVSIPLNNPRRNIPSNVIKMPDIDFNKVHKTLSMQRYKAQFS